MVGEVAFVVRTLLKDQRGWFKRFSQVLWVGTGGGKLADWIKLRYPAPNPTWTLFLSLVAICSRKGEKSNSVELYTFLINKYGSYLLPVNFRPSELLTNLQIYLEALKPAGGAFVKICFILFTLERAESCGCDQSITNHYSKQRALQKKVVSSNWRDILCWGSLD